MAQGQASRPGTEGCVNKGGLSSVGAERVDFEKSGCCSRVMSCGSAGEAGLLPLTVWLAPLWGDLWDEAGSQHCPQIPPGLNSHPVTQALSLSLQTQHSTDH